MKTVLRLVAALICCTCVLNAEARPDRSAIVSLSSTTLDVREPERGIPDSLRAVAGDAGSEDLLLIKFPGPVSAEQIRELERRVERIYTYLPHDAFLVKLAAAEQHRATEPALGASWVGLYHPAYKIAPAVAAAGGASDKLADGPQIVMVHLFPDAGLEATRGKIERLLPGKIVGSGQGRRFSRVRLLLDRAEIAAARDPLARMPEVFWIGVEARRALHNDTTVWVAQSGTTGGQQTPIHDQGLLGQGQIVGVLDTGIDPDMCYFRDAALGLPPVNACDGGTVVDTNQRKVIAVDFLWSSECSGGISSSEWDNHDHGTHVAGTVAGDDFANPLTHDAGDGMAPGAKLVIQDCGFQTNNCADCPGIGCPVVDLNPVFQQPYDQGARIHTNSWGDDENNPVGGLYSAGSEDADEFMWDHKDFLLLFSAGNSGPGSQTVGSPSTGKNVVSVGATLRGGSAESMASFSSCGPTVDGRVKPDITMPGSGIISANSDNNTGTNNCGTRSMSGTSMASPGAAGAAALVRQYYTEGWYPSGAANAPDAFTPSGALLKATLINSGHDMTGAAAIPSNCQGWGRVLLDDSLHFSGESRSLFIEDDGTGFAQGSSGEDRVFQLNVESGEPLKVTLTWTDFPATPAANPTLVNDLDLIVSGPGGTYLGNVFSSGESTTGGSADRLDTVEQVLLANPPAGAYTVTVRSFTVPGGPQPFALVATGDFAQACSVDADCDDGAFCNGTETCDTGSGSCVAGTPPCTGSQQCDEAADQCIDIVCLHDVDFESGAGGWTQGADTCTTGAFIVGTPDATAWQVGGGNPGQAFFTQNNAGGLGTDDVDGGTCEALSPVIDASGQSEVTVSLDYYHGQRDAGDDASDGFTIEVLDGGSVVDTLVSVGDVTNNAAWASVSTALSNPGSLQLRVRATDAAGAGDIVEGGIDNVRVCFEASGGCSSDTDCNDGLFCNGTETCDLGTGTCQAGSAPDCGDGVSCTVDACNEATDVCDNTPDDGACDNGLFCDGAETCSATLGCQAGSDPCSGGACDEAGDVCLECSVDADCDDGLFCNGAETCVGGACQAGSDPCSGGACDEGGDVCLPGGACSHSADFESGAGGWTQGADTCTTGAFIVGTPDATTWQVGGGNPGQAFFTQPNPGGIGSDDVDGGTCEALSPIVDCAGQSAAEVTLDYFHGQRDAGDDAGDGFTIEVLNDGAVAATIVAVGDVTNNPAWTPVSTVVNNPGAIQVRVRATDAAGGGDIVEGGIDNVQVSAATPPSCTYDEGFESGMAGWTNGASTCTTGAYVQGDPTNPGGGQQIVGSHTGSGSLFTAVNTGAGTADVDGGNCVLDSPALASPAAAASTLSVWYWHGQRDNADDPNGGAPNGDFFILEVSTDGGANWTTMASNGDAPQAAAWTEATAAIPAGSDVRVRVQCSDGSSAGDLVECGIDDVSICN